MAYLHTPTASNVDPAALREHWMQTGLDERDLDPNPLRQFEHWYQQTIDAQLPEPNAFTLATVDAEGQPHARTVLLKLYDAQGFVFFTNFNSAKARQMTDCDRVALLFPWAALARQIQITGRVQRLATAESLAYFVTRPRGSQLGAWASPQSQVIGSRSLLEAQFAKMQQKFGDGEIPLPDFWGGYRVIPHTIEFWQGRHNRLHDRFRYRRTENSDSWHIERLAP